jgi:AraC-like DNA-binding protein
MQPAVPPTAAHAVFEAEANSTVTWRGVIAQSLLPLNFETHNGQSFRGTVRAHAAGGVHFADVDATGHAARRGPADIQDGRGAYVLCQLRDGSADFTQHGRTARLSPGEFLVYDSTLPLDIACPAKFSTRFVTFPREMAGIAPGPMRDLVCRSIAPTAQLAPALTATLAAMAPILASLPSQSRLRSLSGVVGLATALFLDELGEPAAGENTGRLSFERLTGYIEENLDRPELGPRALAEAHFVSLRLIHQTFAAEGTTVGSWIRSRRLERCREDMVRPELKRTPVAVIAERWGINSASHFNDVFRQAYGETPAQYRRRVLQV